MANLLASEPSAYLKSAAHQPVHWHPWGDAAFDTARTLDKPILLDIGAVWCHWCHVMDGESYEDPDIARLLNDEFVCIKVDRDERPDVDARYQRAVQALTGQGGWPLTAFLNPSGEVFCGGTYFPPESNPFGRPGFASVLRQVARLYREQRDKVAQNAQAIRQHVTEALNEAKRGTPAPRLLEDAANHMARLFDIRYGGFGTAPKFPHPAACEFLLARWHDTREDWIREVVEKTLTAMARGGIGDWVLAVLADRERGAFYTSQDADTGFGDDGDYWTWTPDEVRDALQDEKAYQVVRHVYDVETEGEMHHNPRKNVLWWRESPAGDDEWPILHDALRKLQTARARRPAPAVDATGDDQWLRRAVAIMHHCGRAHWDAAAGGFFDIARDQGGPAYLATPAKPVQDSPTPSGNGAAALVLARLWALTDDAEWRRLLDRQLESFAGAAAELSLHGATLLRAIDWALNPVTRIEVAGPRGAGAACAMHLVALQPYRPRTVVLRKTADRPTATVCVGTTCSLPVATPEALRDLLR